MSNLINNQSDSIWIEKYRPRRFSDIILSPSNDAFFRKCIEQKSIPHILFHGRAGIGKTSLGKVIATELGSDFLYINGSKEKTIDILRNTIYRFASTYSDSNVWDDSNVSVKKIVFIDECEKITFQESLKVILEEMEGNCRFILATNNKSMIIDPLKGERCQEFNLEPSSQDERRELAQLYEKRLASILQTEGVEYDTKVLKKIVAQSFPSLRKAISTCQKTFLTHGKVTSEIVFDDLITPNLVDMINNKDDVGLRKFCVNTDPVLFMREFFENYNRYFATPDERFLAAQIYSEYAYRGSVHDDREANLWGFLLVLSSKVKLTVPKV